MWIIGLIGLIVTWITIGVIIHTLLDENDELLGFFVTMWPVAIAGYGVFWWIELVTKVTKTVKQRFVRRRNEED